jgi:ATP-dependent Clp protease ATP-binding subunit ClpA
MIERFDRPARAALEGAYQAARELEHNQVGTEHLLLGVLAQADTSAAGALVACGATLEGCRVKVAEAVASKRPGTAAPDLTFTDRAHLALERAGRLSLRQRCEHVEVRHILLSVLDVEGTAGQVLRGLSVDPDCVRQRLGPPSSRPVTRDAPEPDARPAGPSADVRPCCPRCGSQLDSTLAHRVVTSRDADADAEADADAGAVPARFVIVYCSECGCAIAAVGAAG